MTTEVTQGTLTTLAGNVRTTQTDIEGKIGQLRGQLSNLETQWIGQGGTAFTGVIQAWERTARRVTGAMENFEANLKGSEATYNESEDIVAGGLNKYQDGRLG